MISEHIHDFLTNWEESKSRLDDTMQANKAYNEELRRRHNITTQDRYYKANKRSLQISADPTASLLLAKMPQDIHELTSLPREIYKIEGSVGKGEISEIPWVCVFHRSITESATTGYYIVYLFRADYSGLYMSLNQGWTQYKNTYGRDARTRIKANAEIIKEKLRSVEGFDFGEISLSGRTDLATGYELGNICSKYYSVNDLPSSERLIHDLNGLIGVYTELRGLIGMNILDIENRMDEAEYQQAIQRRRGRGENLPDGEVPRGNRTGSGNSSSSWGRIANRATTALENAEFRCENDPSHQTFPWANSEHQYVEGHHLIPIANQGDFTPSIDVPENIICLCPNCHSAFHYASDEVKSGFIEDFHTRRIEGLSQRGVGIQLHQLKGYYGIT